jgi:hypothetical protein
LARIQLCGWKSMGVCPPPSSCPLAEAASSRMPAQTRNADAKLMKENEGGGQNFILHRDSGLGVFESNKCVLQMYGIGLEKKQVFFDFFTSNTLVLIP